MMGLAYLHGTGVGKNSKSAYCWLRMSQRSSALMQHQCYAALEQLKAENPEAYAKPAADEEAEAGAEPGEGDANETNGDS